MKKARKIILLLSLLFVVLFAFRMGYGYVQYPNGQVSFDFDYQFHAQSTGLSNIASAKYKRGSKEEISGAVSVDQKFEKIANIACRTASFDEDEKNIRSIIQADNAIIQFQQKSGNVGKQRLYLQIGVQPKNFDSFVEKIKENQDIVDFNMSKKDKTNEYRELNAKIKTLQATRESLAQLKSKGGQIEEYINLENRILDIDQQLQQLGVRMGAYDSENEFCTVNISLREGTVNNISLMKRVKVALEWTVKYHLLIVAILSFSTAFPYLLLLLLEKLKLLAWLKKTLTGNDN